jgi:hypothetical protein
MVKAATGITTGFAAAVAQAPLVTEARQGVDQLLKKTYIARMEKETQTCARCD